MRVVYTTFGNMAQAEKIANLAVKDKLAACVNVFPITSIYRWKNKAQKEREVACYFKTTKSKVSKLVSEIERIHPYDVPIIEVQKPEQINKEYLGWLNKEIG